MKIYISHPMTGLREKVYADAFANAERHIARLGHEAVNPMRIQHQDLGNYDLTLTEDLCALRDECDAIVMLGGWERSKGCTTEHHFALSWKKRIYYSLDDMPRNEDVKH